MKCKGFHAAWMFLFLWMGAALPGTAQFYANAVAEGGGAGVIYNATDGYYYGVAQGFYTKQAGLPNGSTGTQTVVRSTSLADLFHSTDTIQVPVTAGVSAAGSPGGITSPNLLAYQGQLYLYYRSSNGPTHVAFSPPGDPTGTWTDRNDISFPGYDYDPFYRTATGELYLFYVTTHHIHAQKMLDPLTPDPTRPQQVISSAVENTSLPDYRAWEHEDNLNPPGANEAPAAFTQMVNGQPTTYITYSANTYQGDDYALGLLQYANNDGTDQMDSAANWTKVTSNTTPFLQSSTDDGHGNFVTGTGANTIVADRSGNLWDIYNAYFNGAATNNREIRMDPIAVDATGAPLDPQPTPSREGALLALPAGDPATTTWFVSPDTNMPATYQYNNPNIFYSNVGGGQKAPWQPITGQAATYEGTTAQYAYYLIQFTGRSIAVFGPSGPGFGQASIYQDGTWVHDVDFSQPVASGPIYTGFYPKKGEHTLLVLTKPPAAGEQPGSVVGMSSFEVSNCPITLVGDVNGDGKVDVNDFYLVLGSFGKYSSQPGYNAAADINKDGVINFDDLVLVAENIFYVAQQC